VVGLLIAALSIGALLTIALIVIGPDESDTNGRIAQTVFALGFTGVTGVAGSNLARKRTIHAGFGYLTMAVALVAFAIVTISIWSLFGVGDTARISAYSLILAFATAHASYLLLPAGEAEAPEIQWLKLATILPLVVLVVMAFIDISDQRETVGQDALGVVVTLYLLGVALLPLLRRFSAS
jgi:hypothetical protein